MVTVVVVRIVVRIVVVGVVIVEIVVVVVVVVVVETIVEIVVVVVVVVVVVCAFVAPLLTDACQKKNIDIENERKKKHVRMWFKQDQKHTNRGNDGIKNNVTPS